MLRCLPPDYWEAPNPKSRAGSWSVPQSIRHSVWIIAHQLLRDEVGGSDDSLYMSSDANSLYL